MRQELKSGIPEFDMTVEQFENGEISFLDLVCRLWNKGYSAGVDDTLHKHGVMQAEGSDGAEGAAVGQRSVGQNVSACPQCGESHNETDCNGYCTAWCLQESEGRL